MVWRDLGMNWDTAKFPIFHCWSLMIVTCLIWVGLEFARMMLANFQKSFLLLPPSIFVKIICSVVLWLRVLPLVASCLWKLLNLLLLVSIKGCECKCGFILQSFPLRPGLYFTWRIFVRRSRNLREQGKLILWIILVQDHVTLELILVYTSRYNIRE